jgi:hypothetical protein
VPNGLGVNIHFTDARPGEFEMLAVAGFHWVRMDFSWGGMEQRPGEYDFSAYDRLLASLETQKLRALFILDYGNHLYLSSVPLRRCVHCKPGWVPLAATLWPYKSKT